MISSFALAAPEMGSNDAAILRPTSTMTTGAGCVRSRGAAAKAAKRLAPWSVPAPLLEEARPASCKPPPGDCVRSVVLRLIAVALAAAVLSLAAAVAVFLLGCPMTLVWALLATGVTIQVCCWLLYLCSCAQKSRAILAALLMPRKERNPRASDEMKTRHEWNAGHEESSAAWGGNYWVAV
ncbi:hypothetical protein V5799_016572 [Amblyomma americanum]|uniref:Uncharacterized protein n=1 Tax=Amblyomma americanum TaxID=6943 RepID=A0AAQ4F5Z9_AMBAM